MPSTKEYLDFVLGQLDGIGSLTFRKMMGEYLLYLDGVYFGNICDNRFLIKKTPSMGKYETPEQIPYPGAKPMLMPSDPDDTDTLKRMALDACADLKK